MSGTRAAEGVDDEVAGVVAGLDDGLAQEIAGLGVLHRVDGRGGVLDREAERFGDARTDGFAGEIQVQSLAAAEKTALRQDSEHEVGVGVRRFGTALSVAGRARHGLRAVGADLQVAAGVEPGDRATAGADRVDLEGGHVDRMVIDDRRR